MANRNPILVQGAEQLLDQLKRKSREDLTFSLARNKRLAQMVLLVEK